MTEPSKAVAVADKPARNVILVEDSQSLFDTARFEQMQRIGTALMFSSMLPDSIQGPSNLPFEDRARVTCSNIILLADVADRWKMPMMSVIQSCSIIHGRICFEGKLIMAVIEQRLGVRLDYKWNDLKGDEFGIVVSGRRETDTEDKWISGTVGDWATTEKSGARKGNWVGNAARMQLAYRGAREWCRLWAPWIMLGVYGDDEMDEIEVRRAETRVASATATPSTFSRPALAAPAQETDDGSSQEQAGTGDNPDGGRQGAGDVLHGSAVNTDAPDAGDASGVRRTEATGGGADGQPRSEGAGRDAGKGGGVSGAKGTGKGGSVQAKAKPASEAEGGQDAAIAEDWQKKGYADCQNGLEATPPEGQIEAVAYQLGYAGAEAQKAHEERLRAESDDPDDTDPDDTATAVEEPDDKAKIETLADAAKAVNGIIDEADAWADHDRTLAVAEDWRTCKTALLTLSKTQAWADAGGPTSEPVIRARKNTWQRNAELLLAGKSQTTPVDDMTAYRCWIEWETSVDVIEETWGTMLKSILYTSSTPENQKSIEVVTTTKIGRLVFEAEEVVD